MTTSFGSDDPFADWWNSGAMPSPSGSNPAAGPDWATDFLEENPEYPFQGALAKANLTPNQYQTFRNQRDSITKQFMGQLANQLRQGILPTDTATNFFDKFDWAGEFQRLGPNRRFGGDVGAFAPPVRYNRRGN